MTDAQVLRHLRIKIRVSMACIKLTRDKDIVNAHVFLRGLCE